MKLMIHEKPLELTPTTYYLLPITYQALSLQECSQKGYISVRGTYFVTFRKKFYLYYYDCMNAGYPNVAN